MNIFKGLSEMVNLNSHVTRTSSACYQLFLKNLKALYQTKLLPLEKMYEFNYFHSPPLEDGDFDVTPMIVFLGQYSTGKTSLIKYLLNTDYPGMLVGPEPTTDKFIFVTHGNTNRIIPGNALAVDPKKQFKTLSKFGNSFLNKFQCSQSNCSVLKNLSLVDTPGILSGEKQRIDRGYDFVGVLRWFVERADRVMLLFDAHKLDISDEFRFCIEALKGYDDKVQIVLNKSDAIDEMALMRVYGALMWSLAKIFNTPEVVRIYVGSFWDQPLRPHQFQKLFEADQKALLSDLMYLPTNSALRKLNDFLKRVRLAKVHAYIMGTLHSKMPVVFGKYNRKKELIHSLEQIFSEIEIKYNLSGGDLPNLYEMQQKLDLYNFSNLTYLNKKIISDVDEMIENDIAKLMGLLHDEGSESEKIVSGGAFGPVKDTVGNSFDHEYNKEASARFSEKDWIVSKHRTKYDTIFNVLIKSGEGKIDSHIAQNIMRESKLPSSVLSQILKLSDIDKDNALDADEFALAMYLVDIKLDGHDVPTMLPDHLVPPSKRE